MLLEHRANWKPETLLCHVNEGYLSSHVNMITWFMIVAVTLLNKGGVWELCEGTWWGYVIRKKLEPSIAFYMNKKFTCWLFCDDDCTFLLFTTIYVFVQQNVDLLYCNGSFGNESSWKFDALKLNVIFERDTIINCLIDDDVQHCYTNASEL